MSTALSILLHGTLEWTNSMKILHRRREMVKIQQRAALRCVSAYCTVLTEALCVLASSPPIELLAEERAVVFKAK